MKNLESHGVLQYHSPGLESHGIWVVVMDGKLWKITENDFSESNRARNTSNECSFSHYFENNFSILGHRKHQKSPGKAHGKS